ncbi:MAG: putative DNA-binding domain-containing protein [Candidatus Thiothrix singaporensis]|uniref:DNA-binding domain-containing protein n=1 Tax=Candidatus Thiothrix singaporensis TaxID=2799669 RepID=A0A7L6ARK3_9GAMM|nr:MAG: putative DNA-binding domain-containing protein [Candidatus Thiothrix singaporensis]
MSLPDLQTRFIAAIFDRNQRAGMAELVKSQGALDAAQRVGIYRNSVHGVLLQHLGALYEVTRQLVGEAFFERLSDEFVDHAPPTRPFLVEYGDAFPAFMQRHAALEEMPWLADVARLEWARHQAWHAVNQPAGDFTQIMMLSEGQQASLCFQMPGSAQLVQSPYAVHQVWLAHQPEDFPGKLPLERIQIPQPAYVLVWRAGRQLRQVEVDEAGWDFLSALQQGATLPVLTERFQEQLPGLLTTAMQRGWILSFTADS